MSSTNFKDIELFDGKTFDQLLKDIYSKSEKKSKDFDKSMSKLMELAVKDSAAAAMLFPMLIEYAEVSVKNDDTLVKLARIVQGFFSKNTNNQSTESSDWILPESERELLLKNYNSLKEDVLEIESIEIPDKLEVLK